MAVIKGGIRGNGRQLGGYLLAKKDNESVRVLEVDGATEFTQQEFRELLTDFSLNEKLTKSKQGIYHGIINPEEDYSRTMSDKDWQQGADILMESLPGFAGQRRAIVLHTKHGRTHAHVAIERYNHETGKMIPIPHNYRAHDKARARMEAVFNQQPTPTRNPHRPEMKAVLTKLWNKHGNANGFIQEAKKAGYVISNGFGRSPYMVVDDTGRSFNLTRHLDGVKLKDVRERFKNTILPEEKDAISFIRTQEMITGQRSSKARQKVRPAAAINTENEKRAAFIENLNRIKTSQQQKLKGPKMR